MINAEAVIQTLIANIGNPDDIIAKAEAVQIPHISRRGLEAVRKRFALAGQAMAYRSILGFLQRLKQSMDMEKKQGEAERAQEQPVATEGIGPWGRKARITTEPPKLGFTDVAFEAKLNSRLATMDEDLAVHAQDASLAAEQGRFVVNGEIAVGNHADILKLLVMWLLENKPEVMQAAVNNMANMVRKGTVLRGD